MSQIDDPSVELDLRATAKQVFLAIVEVAERAGCVVDVVQAALPPDRPCRVAARRVHGPVPRGPGTTGGRGLPGRRLPGGGVPSGELGPAVMTYEFRDAGGGHVHVRITQCGFGDQAGWDAAFEPWGRRGDLAPWRAPGGRRTLPDFPVD